MVSAKLSWKQVYDNLQRITESRTTYRCPACGLREDRLADEPAPRCVRCAAPMVATGGDLVIHAQEHPIPPGDMEFLMPRADMIRLRDAFYKLADCPVGTSIDVPISDLYTLKFIVSAPDVERPSAEANTCNASADAFLEVARAMDRTITNGRPSEVAVPFNGSPRVVVKLHEPPAIAPRRHDDLVDATAGALPGPRLPKSGDRPVTPAPHQVRRTQCGGDLVVVAVGDHEVRVRLPDRKTYSVPRHYFDDWPCVGIELPDGRHMLVGETWEYTFRKWSDLRQEHEPHMATHVLRGVGVNPVGEVEFVKEGGGSLGFDAVTHDDASRWRKVDGPSHVSAVLSTRATLNSFLYAAHAYRLADRIPFPEGGVAPPTPTPAPRCFDWSRPPLPTAAGLAALGAFFDVVATVAQLPTAEGRTALRDFFAGVGIVLGSDAFFRDAYRRQIEAAMAGASPAERCAVLAACEQHTPMVGRIPDFLAALRRYEAGRARGMTPERARLEVDGFDVTAPDSWSRVGFEVYERVRGQQ